MKYEDNLEDSLFENLEIKSIALIPRFRDKDEEVL